MTDERENTGRFRQVLEDSADRLVQELDQRRNLTKRERELARDVAMLVAERLPDVIRQRPDNLRLAEVEQRATNLEAWRLKTSGVDDSNGRLGRMDRAIAACREDAEEGLVRVRAELAAAQAELRKDIGTPEQRDAERAAAAIVNGTVRRYKLTFGAAVTLVLTGGGYAVWRSLDNASRAEARLEQRLHQHDVDVDRLYQFCRAPRPDPITPDP